MSRIKSDSQEEKDESISALFESEVEEADFLKELKGKQREDPEVENLIRECKARGGNFNNFAYVDEVLFCLRKGRRPYDPKIVKRVVIPKSLRNEALALCHDGFGGAHLGEKKTWSKIAEKFYWPSAYGDTLKWVQSC